MLNTNIAILRDGIMVLESCHGEGMCRMICLVCPLPLNSTRIPTHTLKLLSLVRWQATATSKLMPSDK